MFNKHEIARNACQLYGGQSKCGYDWWWHSFTARHEKTGEEQAFFIEYFLCNPHSGSDMPAFGQLEENKERHQAVLSFFSQVMSVTIRLRQVR